MLTGATASVANIDVSQSTTVAAIDISGSTDYQITDLSGTASLELQIDTQLFFGQNVSINVLAGDHVFDIPVNAGSDTDIVVSSGASLSLDESFDFNGMTVTKSGAGTLYVNNDTVSGSGILNVSSGVLSGTGHVNGDVFVTGGVVAPGQSVGNLDIAGDFTLESNATLQIEIASLASKDFLFVDDGAVLSGTLDIELIGGYQPNHGDQFLIMIADSFTDLGLTIDAEDSRDFTYSVLGNTLMLTSIVPPTPQWVGGASGDWNTAANWSPAAVPDSNDVTVNLTGAAFPATAIQLDSSVMVRKLNVDNSSSFQVSGSGTMQLDDLLNQAEVAVAGGDHTLNVDLHANVNATFDIAAGASLSLDDTFGFDAVTVTKLGTGTLTINSDTVSGSGTLQLVDGTLAGTGHVNGDLVVTGGVLAPGQSVGRLDVTGDLTMDLNSTLQIEIASLSSKDLLSVDGNVILSGTLDIELVGGYQPNGGDQFLIMIADSFFDNGLTLSGPDVDNFQLNFLGNALVLEALASVLPGDYDGDGIVAGGDFIMWQNTLGDSVLIGTAADGDGSGVIDQADLAIWTSNYGTSSLAASSSSAAVPEPASSVLLLGMIIVIAARAQRLHRCGSGRGVVPGKLRLSAGFCRE
jgi:cytoskeletal protein CcmA (bactofilin family)